MKKEVLVITDLTRMGGDRVCLAGVTRDGVCVRPELPRGHFTESWLYANGEPVVSPFAAIEFQLLQPMPRRPHTEDRLVCPSRPVVRGRVEPPNRDEFLHRLLDPSVQRIFGATGAR
jgi:hypothetical protein